MGIKTIGIIYYNNNFKSFGKGQYMLNNIARQLVVEERKVVEYKENNIRDISKIVFEDGSKVMLIPFSQSIRGYKFTDIYIDGKLKDVNNMQEFTNTLLSNSLEKTSLYYFDFFEDSVKIYK